MSQTKHAFNCQEPGCMNPADEYKLPDPANIDGPDEIHYYCRTHAHDAGFCPECKRFFGGIESFEVNPLGVCAECFEALQDDVVETHDAEEEEHLLSFDELNLPKVGDSVDVDDPVNGIRATFDRIAAAHPHKQIKCPYCHGESFTAHLSDDNHLALYCDACEEQVLVCQANDLIEWHVLKLQKKERDN